jgi:glutamine phosphoribosylpyrophosphate amidotransferase
VGGALAIDRVGGFTASGFVFKDSVEVLAINDPDGMRPLIFHFVISTSPLA